MRLEDSPALDEALRHVLEEFSIADSAYDAAIERTQRYARSLENDREFGVVGSRIGGSIGKGTAIAPMSDVDLYLYLDDDVWRSMRGGLLSPHTVIGRVRSRVEKRLCFEIQNGYATIRPQRHSVGIKFRKENSVGIDVVPALVSGRDVEAALIPRRPTGMFVETSVERQIELINALDSPFRYLRRGIRLLKHWNKTAGVGLHSYIVEVLGMYAAAEGCTRTAAGVFISTLDFIAETDMREPVYIEHYFRFSRRASRACSIFDPAMPNNNLGEAMSARDGERLGAAARRALHKLCKAAEFFAWGKFRVAEECVAEVFGRVRFSPG